jgi:hypothetical protein
MMGTTGADVQVFLDGENVTALNVYASPATYVLPLWFSGTLANTTHTLQLVCDGGTPSGRYLNLDAFDVWGTID